MITWYVLDIERARIEIVENYDTLDAAVEAMGAMAWEDTSRRMLDYLADEAGDVVATAMFGPGLELYVTTMDGRMLRFEMPERYREGA